VSLEEAREVRLIGKAGAQRDVRERGVWRVEHPARALEPKRKEMLVRCAPDGLLERTREVRGRQPGDASE
jgi:hypothetical protein